VLLKRGFIMELDIPMESSPMIKVPTVAAPETAGGEILIDADNVSVIKEMEEDEWYGGWVTRNNIRFEKAKAAGA
jgi:hypothetical protein